jgi:hypothetical protein
MLISMVKKKKTRTFHWDEEANKAFNIFKELFIITLILRMFDSLFRTRLETNASRYALKIIIS